MNWINLEAKKPPCKRAEEGTPVLVYPYKSYDDPTPRVMLVFYGRRLTRQTGFYLYGSLVNGITHWMPIPNPPTLPDPPPRSP